MLLQLISAQLQTDGEYMNKIYTILFFMAQASLLYSMEDKVTAQEILTTFENAYDNIKDMQISNANRTQFNQNCEYLKTAAQNIGYGPMAVRINALQDKKMKLTLLKKNLFPDTGPELVILSSNNSYICDQELGVIIETNNNNGN